VNGLLAVSPIVYMRLYALPPYWAGNYQSQVGCRAVGVADSYPYLRQRMSVYTAQFSGVDLTQIMGSGSVRSSHQTVSGASKT